MIQIFNTLGRKEEKFVPINKDNIGIYTCGPTVYSYVTVGNWRTYVLSDIVVRTLRYAGYNVNAVMNITDVGHLTGDNEGDSSTGEDRMEKAEKKEGKTAWEIAEFYANDFYEGMNLLNITRPNVIPKPTEHIPEQIELINQIIEKEYVYLISDGLYFDITKFEADGNNYGELSNLDQIKEGARVAINEEKKDPRDFALWKFSPANQKRHMEWNFEFVLRNLEYEISNISEYSVQTEVDIENDALIIKGKGFPGWHIECSAMGMKYLGEQFDIHIGGEDLLSTHHPCEIAQSEAATGEKPFVKYWIHGAFLQVDGGKMGKSLGNAYTLHDLEEKGYSPLDLRYFYFSAHYSKKLNFTWEALNSAKNARQNLVSRIKEMIFASVIFKNENATFDKVNDKYLQKINEYFYDNFSMPEAIATLWDLLKDEEISNQEKIGTIKKIDDVLGLSLMEYIEEFGNQVIESKDEILSLITEREKARDNKEWAKADEIRDNVKERFGVSV